MANIDQIQVGSNTYDIVDNTARTQNATHHVYYVKGTQTAKTGSWTGSLPEVEALYEGLEINYWLPYEGDGNATLNLTLKNGTTTGAINCYHTGTSRLTTHIPVNAWCKLIYQTVTISGTSYTGWWLLKAYDSNDRASILYRGGNSYYIADSVVYRYQLLFQMDENRFTPLNNANNVLDTTKTMLTDVEFDPLGDILYWESTSTINANGNITNTAKWSINMDLRYSFNCGTTILTAHKPLYLKVTLQPSGKVKLSSAMPLVQELPTTNDGYLYIHLGRTYSTYQLSLYPIHHVYYHDGIKIREYDTITFDRFKKNDSGNIVHFLTDEAYPLSKLQVGIEPVQDLHGQDSPYPAGGGKNLLPKGENRTNNGITFTVQDNGEVIVTGTASALAFWGVQFTLPAGTYILNGCPSGAGESTYQIDIRNAVGGSGISGIGADRGTGWTFTLTESLTAYVNIRIANGYACPSGGIKFSPMIRLSSVTDATFAPYSNACPITGHTEAVVTRTGKNLLPLSQFVTKTSNDVTCTVNSDGTISLSGTASGTPINAWFMGNYAKPDSDALFILKPGTYTLRGVALFRGTSYVIAGNYLNSTTKTITEDTPITGIRMGSGIVNGTNYDGVTVYPQLEVGSVATEFENSDLQTVTIDLGGTRYGATVNVLTGEMKVTYGIKEYTEVTPNDAYVVNGTYYYPKITDSVFTVDYGDIICNALMTAKTYSQFALNISIAERNTYVVINPKIGGYATVAEAVNAGNQLISDIGGTLQVCYPLATPVTVQLDPETLNLLQGDNYIWSSTGDIEAEYAVVHPIANGGTGATTASEALTALGAASASEVNTALGLKSDKTSDAHHVYYVKGTQTSSTGAWTGVLSEVDALYEGLIIDYYLPYAGSGNATLNLTLRGGTTTGAINCYLGGTSRLTTQIPQYYTCSLIYQTITVSGTSYTGWYLLRSADNNDVGDNLKITNSRFTANSVIYRYQLLFHTDSETVTPLTNDNNSTGTSKTMLTNVEFDPLEKIYYWYTQTTWSSGSINPENNFYYQRNNVDLRYSLNCGTTLTTNAFLYLKVVPQSNGKVKLAPDPCWAQSLPSTNDGYAYILLGRTYSTYQIALYSEHPYYVWDGTKYERLDRINMKSPEQVKTEDSGSIVHFNTDEGYPLNKLKINFEPILDYSKYIPDIPLGGRGNNVWDEEWEIGGHDEYGEKDNSTDKIRSKNDILVQPNTSYRIVVPSGASVTVYVFTEDDKLIEVFGTSGSFTYSTPRYYTIEHDGFTEELDVDTCYLRFHLNSNYGTTYKNDFAINYPSSVTTYTPYINKISISGHSSAVVTRCKNILGTMQIGKAWNGSSNSDRAVVYAPCKPNTEYKLYISDMSAFSAVTYFEKVTESSDNYTVMDISVKNNTMPVSKTTQSNSYFIGIQFTKTSISSADFTGIAILLCESTDYASVTIDLGGTRYGCMLDVLMGTLTVDRVGQTYTSVMNAYSTSTASYAGYVANDGLSIADSIKANVIASYLAPQTANYLWTHEENSIAVNNLGLVYIKITGMTSKADYDAYLTANPLQVVYELATPITVQLSPEALNLLKGDSYIWSENGDIEASYAKVHPISSGGTGATTASDARTNLGATNGVWGVSVGGTGGSDSGWLTMESDKASAGTIDYRKVGIFLLVKLNELKLKSKISSRSVSLGTLPDGYRPDSAFYGSISYYNPSTSMNHPSTFRIGEDGSILAYRNGSTDIPANSYLNGIAMIFTV